MRRFGVLGLLSAVLAGLLQVAGTREAAAHEQVHVVRWGESLSVIAHRYGTTVRALQDANALADPHHVLAGRRVRIPAGGGGGGGEHVIRPGESLSAIAHRYGTSLAELRRANAIDDPNRIISGRRLQIPSGAGGGRGSYVVRPGESLSVIAQRHGVSTDALALANGIGNPDIVWAGKTLTLPSEVQVRAARSEPMRAVGVPSSRAHLRPLFEHYAAQNGVPADLAMALAWQESGWQQSVVSSTGAVGVMQLMPDTVDFVSRVLLRLGRRLDPHDPEQNIRMGTRQLRYLMDQTGGDLHLTLAAYYQGLGAVRRHGPYEESKRFSANVLALRSRFVG